MAELDHIEGLPNGARFYRADLHIHSFDGSHDVQDNGMTPQRIVETAVGEKLSIIAIADHNEIRNVAPAVAAARAANDQVLVIPAVELSTQQGHLLCYLPSTDTLERFFARLALADRGTPTSRCQTSIHECLNLLEQFNGFGVLAHVDADKGFERENPGASQHKMDVLCHRSLLGIELKTAASPVYYSDEDADQTRVAIGRQRIERLKLGSKQFLARLLNSDSHSLAALGRNAQGDRKVTRTKMDRPSFDGLRIALQDSDARIRLEDLIPLAVPHIVGMKIDGGFLDGQSIHFSQNLNCIIGGRGTGKSTTFEAVRILGGETAERPVVDSEIWPVTLRLFWRDQAGQVHSLVRQFGGSLENVDDPLGPDRFQLESYGQGETAHISKEAQGNPIALLGYLDRFVDVGALNNEEGRARDELLELRSEIVKAQAQVELIPQFEKSLATTVQQLAALERAKAKEVIELQRKLATEREVRNQLVRKLDAIRDKIDNTSPKQAIKEVIELADPSTLVVGRSQFEKIIESALAFGEEADAAQGHAKAGYDKFKSAVEAQLTTWKANDAVALRQIDEKRRALEAQNIRLDMAYIQKLAEEEASLKQSVANLKTWKPHLDEQRRKYAAASKKRWAARERIAMTREAFAKAASDTLKSALSDLVVSLKFSRSAHSPDAEQQITQAMGWRTIQVPRSAVLIEALTLPGLLDAIDKKKVSTIAAVVTAEGGKLFDNAEAAKIIERLSEDAIRFGLERCAVYDLPRLTVTRAIELAGKKRYITRDF